MRHLSNFGYRQARRAPRGYYNCSSFAIYHERVYQVGERGPEDKGEFQRIRRMAIVATMQEAQEEIERLRDEFTIPENEYYTVTERIHDEHGKIVDTMMDEYVG